MNQARDTKQRLGDRRVFSRRPLRIATITQTPHIIYFKQTQEHEPYD